jgi:cytochrome c oxidase cbb3-type subunit 3
MIRRVAVVLALIAHPALAAEDARFAPSAHLYDTYCAQCHGVQRNGKGINTAALTVQPRDHSDTKGMVSIPVEEMTKAIKEGGAAVNKSALMPPWGSVLTDAQIAEMVAYLRHVCRCDAAQ